MMGGGSNIRHGEGGSEQPTELQSSLRWRLDIDENVRNIEKPTHSLTVQRNPTKSALRNHSTHTRYCPSGHVLVINVPRLQRQHYLRQQQRPNLIDSNNLSILPNVGCDACGNDIMEERIGATCTVCDIDFCQLCYNQSGKSVEELLSHAREIMATTMITMNPHPATISLTSSSSSSSSTMSSSLSATSVEGGSLWSFNSTHEFCAAGHELVFMPTVIRQRYLQERDRLDVLPMIECDCCSKEIRDAMIAGCDVTCDIDICKDCFRNGQSYEDVLEDRRPEFKNVSPQPNKNNESVHSKSKLRYNGRRPTYRGTGRVTYDEYPDPTAFQWTFTGSSKSRPVEYFEKDFGPEVGLVLLDMYYTTGTVKTTLLHPTRGDERVLFSNDNGRISSHSYRKILKEPCSHNNRRYRFVGTTDTLLL
jgi:ribosome-binding protein aMBF1 (putative translation factor)